MWLEKNQNSPKRGVISSLFHHHSHHSHSSSKSLSTSHSLPSSQSLSPQPKDGPFALSMMEEIVDYAEPIITKWDLNSSSYTKVTFLFHHSRKEAKEFVKSVRDLRRAMNYLLEENTSSARLVLAQKLMQIAMQRLEKELYQILSENRESLDPESISGRSSTGSSSSGEEDNCDEEKELQTVNESISEVERVSALAMSDLKSIADCMVVCGYAKEFVKIYKVLRKSIVDEGMYRLKIERFKSTHVHKLSSEALAEMSKNWINAVNVAVKTLFKGEKILCDHVFSMSETIRDACFHEITKEAAINLFRFPELAAKAKKSSPEKIIQLMELYEAFSDLWPEIETIFNSDSTADLRSQALSSSLKLRDTIHSILPDFEAAIQKDHFSSKTPAPGGGIHQMTRSVMEYISSLADHSGVLSGILVDYPPAQQGSSKRNESFLETPTYSDGSPGPDAVSVHLAWLILVLLCKLDCKAELYKDAALSYLFLANNLHYIVEKVRTTISLRLLLGDEWVTKHAKKVNQYAHNYESMAWTKVLLALPDSAAAAPLSAEEAKERFRMFGAAFDEAYKKQTSWVVNDGKLRNELKVSIARKIVSKYREFYDENVMKLSEEKGWESMVRFSPDDLGNHLSDLFHGASTSATSKSSFSFSSSLSSSSSSCLSA